MVQNFAFFVDRVGCRENKNREILNGRRNGDIIACEWYWSGGAADRLIKAALTK